MYACVNIYIYIYIYTSVYWVDNQPGLIHTFEMSLIVHLGLIRHILAQLHPYNIMHINENSLPSLLKQIWEQLCMYLLIDVFVAASIVVIIVLHSSISTHTSIPFSSICLCIGSIAYAYEIFYKSSSFDFFNMNM